MPALKTREVVRTPPIIWCGYDPQFGYAAPLRLMLRSQFMIMQRSTTSELDIASIALRYSRGVRAFFLRRVRDRAEAEDLTQDVFASLLRRAGGERIENVEGYVFQVAANLLRDRARRQGARPAIQCEGFADPFSRLIDEISPERTAIGKDTYRRFVQALETLPERPRMVFVLNRFEEMTGREIAASLGISQRQVEKDISRVLTLLREQLP
jgi:RNA polymerase sigma factor (sigma-70 family)